MSKMRKVLHRQTFQNSNNIVEVTVKRFPKGTYVNQVVVPKPPTYVRECYAKEKLDKEVDKENKNVCRKPPTASNNIDRRDRVNVEVSKRVRNKPLKNYSSWAEALEKYRKVEVEPCNDSELECGSRKKRLENQAHTWHQKTSQTPDSQQSNISELIVNRQIQSPTSLESVPQRVYESVDNENYNARSCNNSRSSCHSHKVTRKLSAERSVRRTTHQEAALGMHQDQYLEPAKVHENACFLSDDATHSPFRESALDLLQQLRSNLQSGGVREGIDVVGALEALFIGQGSKPLSGGPTHNNTRTKKASQLPDHATKCKHVETGDMQTCRTNSESETVSTHCVPDFQPSKESDHDKVSKEKRTKEDDLPGQQACMDVLIREIERQKSVIERLKNVLDQKEEDILELRTLSTQLIKHQERATSLSKVSQPRKETQNQECQTDDDHTERPIRDAESSTPSSSRDYQSNLLLLQLENENLRDEVRRLRETFMLKSCAGQDIERRAHSVSSRFSSSKLSGSAPNLDLLEHHLRENIPQKLVPEKPLSNQVESEVDSAYEEKTSSRMTSKVGSPHSSKQDDQYVSYIKGDAALSLDTKKSSSQQQTQTSYDRFHSSDQLMQEAYGHNQGTTAPSTLRNISDSSEQIPVYKSASPSVELLNSNSLSSKDDDWKSLKSYDNHRGSHITGHGSTIYNHTNLHDKTCSRSNKDSDIPVVYNPGKPIDDSAHPSFSIVSENSIHDSSVDLQELSLGSLSEKPDSLQGERNLGSEVIHSFSEVKNPEMESTRAQKAFSSVYRGSSSDLTFATLKGVSSLKSPGLDSIRETI